MAPYRLSSMDDFEYGASAKESVGRTMSKENMANSNSADAVTAGPAPREFATQVDLESAVPINAVPTIAVPATRSVPDNRMGSDTRIASETLLENCSQPETMRLPQYDSAEAISQLAWALAHPVRIRILRFLLGRKNCVCGEIVDQFSLAQSTISQHLKILKQSGLIQGEVDGPKVCYGVNTKRLAEFQQFIAEL